MLCKGIASGYLVLEHIIVNKNLFPVLVLGRGPTQSLITLENGSLVIGMGFNGADGIFRFGLPTSWHSLHEPQNSLTSLLILG